MRRQSLALAALVLALPAAARAETICDLPRVAQGQVVTLNGKIKSIDVDRGDRSYWVVVELKDQCGTLEVPVTTKQSPRCRAGANVSVTGVYKGINEHMIEAQRIVCVK